MEEWQRAVEDRSVALVGPSRGIIGSRQGEEIEGFDLVARMNHQWPVPDSIALDVGRRMDILFHCCNQDYPVARLARTDFADTRVAFYENGSDAGVLTAICRELGVPAIDMTAFRRDLAATLGAQPSTGLVAVAYLLTLRIRRLKIFGMTFYREPYYEGYLGHGAAPRNWRGDRPAGRIWRHDPEVEYLFFRANFADHPRLRVDGRSATVMGLDFCCRDGIETGSPPIRGRTSG